MLRIVIVSVVTVTGVALLIKGLLTRNGRVTQSELLHDGTFRQPEDENRQLADEPPDPSAEGDSRLTQQLGPGCKPDAAVTPLPATAASQTRCPACSAIITANDESCPSCEISFVADGSQNWTPGTVGPPDGIYRPPSEISE